MSAERPVGIVTDSTSNLQEFGPQFYPEIRIVQARISMGEQDTMDDPGSITTQDVLAWMVKNQAVPTTGAPAYSEFIKAYESFAPDQQILSVHVSGELSQFMNQALKAKNELGQGGDRIEVFDSRQISLALGYMVLEAQRLSTSGMPMEELLGNLRQAQDRIHLIAAFKTLKNARLSGRVSHLKQVMGDALGLKAILTVRDGKIQQEGIEMAWGKAKNRLLQIVESAGPLQRLGVVHAGAEEREIFDMVSRLQGNFYGDIDIGNLGPALATHAGMGAIVISYMTEKPEVVTSYPGKPTR